jgi:menaquinone-dependent protoporphyrinogen oxidase
MMKVLIAYASAHGSTEETARFIKRILDAFNLNVTVAAVQDVESVAEYDAFILGSAIEGGMWLHEMSIFMERFGREIAAKPSYLFITCIRVLEPDGYEHALKYYIHHNTIERLHIENIAVFAGRLNIERIDWNERWLLAVQYDGAVIPGYQNRDFRDWNAIALWALSIASNLHAIPAFEVIEAETRLS